MTRFWYQEKIHPLLFILLPLTFLFRLLVAIRRYCYQVGIFKSKQIAAPVIVVGNITVGGTGKTPFVIWLVKFLQQQGYKPGIISRGVGGKQFQQPHIVTAADAPDVVGDEALVLLQNANCPVVICIDRVTAAQELLRHYDCNIVISDDGLQHYRLKRDIEIAMLDGARRLGNQQLLPAGPLRETPKRLNAVDFVIVNDGDAQDAFTMSLDAAELVAVNNQHRKMPLAQMANQKIRALAGIGNPQRFFTMLRQLGFEIIPSEFPDHYLYSKADIYFNDKLPVIMTEKDAVKCKAYADDRHWYVPVTAKLNTEFENALLAKISEELQHE